MNLTTFKFMNYMSAVILAMCFFYVGMSIYQQYWPIKIIEHHFEQAKILNQNKQVRRGDYLEFEYRYSKYKDLAGVVSRSLVNDRIVHLTCQVGALSPGMNQVKIHRIKIPENIFPGRYQLVTHINYRLNEKREENVSYETEWFEVLP